MVEQYFYKACVVVLAVSGRCMHIVFPALPNTKKAEKAGALHGQNSGGRYGCPCRKAACNAVCGRDTKAGDRNAKGDFADVQQRRNPDDPAA